MNLLTAWGMSETGIATLVRPNDPIEKSIKTDGLPIRGFEVRIVNAEGKDCSIYETGEILVRGPSLFHGYLNDESNNKTSLDNGWLKSGDLGFIDNDGYLRCDGRIKDLIVRGGLNISPAEVEGLLLTHPLIEDVSVVGLPDDRLGERVFAFLVCPSVNLTLKELSEFLTTKGLSIQKHPEQVLFVPELPKTATGKTLKNQLRQTLTAQNKHS
jgi:cyclohexanecarboxylate-CoA ligase